MGFKKTSKAPILGTLDPEKPKENKEDKAKEKEGKRKQ